MILLLIILFGVRDTSSLTQHISNRARQECHCSSLHSIQIRGLERSFLPLKDSNLDEVPVNSVKLARKQAHSFLTAMVALSLLAVPTKRVMAARGAFEMDAEFYFQNIFGTRKEKDPSFFKNGVIFPSPRQLDSTFASKVADIVFRELSLATGSTFESFQELVRSKVPYYLRYFKTFAPIVKEDLTDQYYFDMIMYIAYLEAGTKVKQSEERVRLRERVGTQILDFIVSAKGFNNLPSSKPQEATRASLASSLVNNRDQIKMLLNIFQDAEFISSYKFDDEQVDDIPYVLSSFEENLPVSFQVTLISPVTLLGFMQQVEANTFYHPEILGTTINSYLQRLGLNSKFEDYLMDNYYREENFDIQAQDILLEFIVSAPFGSKSSN